MPTAVLRRYTPPTCTLEIAATGSVLSRWTDRQVMKNVRFSLHFDDPKLPTEQQVVVQGDRSQLEALCEVVGRYVQQLLDPDAVRLSPALQQLLPSAADLEKVGEGRDRPTATILPLPAADPEGMSLAEASQGIAVRPLGLLSHELLLGTLATPESGPTVRLSVTQLFDLANALDSYSEEAIALPGGQRVGRQGNRGRWLRSVAGIVLAVGATATLARFINDIGQPAATQVATSGQPTENQPMSEFPSPAGVLPVPSADLSVPPSPPAGALPNPVALPPPGGPAAIAPATEGQATPRLPAGAAPQPNAVVPPPPGSFALPPVATRRVPQPQPPQGQVPQPMRPRVQAAPAPALPQPQTVQIPELNQLPASGAVGSGTASVPESITTSGTATDGAVASGAAPLTAPDAIARQGNLPSIPQVQQAQTYFEERWQPQPNVSQALEYQIEVAPDGTVAQITPLGATAGTLVDRTGMPLLGDAFVAPLQGQRRAVIRVVLWPDGKVQTFLEQLSE